MRTVREFLWMWPIVRHRHLAGRVYWCYRIAHGRARVPAR